MSLSEEGRGGVRGPGGPPGGGLDPGWTQNSFAPQTHLLTLIYHTVLLRSRF